MKECKSCKRRLAHNNKIGFCLNCIPKKEIIDSFKEGKTITEISESIFNSNSGSYREIIRDILKNQLESSFSEIKRSNKAKLMNKKNTKKLPLDFIKELHKQQKITTQIHKALLQKGHKLHIATLRKQLSELGLDYKDNYKKWLTGRSRTSKKRKKLIRELWLNGESINQISKLTGLATLTVKTYLHQMGFKTKLLQYYYSEPSNEHENLARDYLRKKGFEVKKCLFMCQRSLERPFGEVLSDNKFPFPKDLRKFCKNCPIQNLKFEEQELYDFVTRKEKTYGIVEVKKVYTNPQRRAHFTLGQFLNLPKIIRRGIPFSLIIFDRGKLYEKRL